ncbi:MAG: CDP-glycerol glycerophosphotransferase family protein [Nitrosopumilus sp.]|nr:CDP-glycerol glycerophosphotransferase family protein [Nitrosopumilus sp.]
MIKILVAHHTLPDITTAGTIFFENFLPVMRKYGDVNMTWLIYGPEKITIPSKINDNVSIIDIHDFSNGLEVIKKIKPDIVFSSFSNNPINHALAIAAQHEKVLLIGEYHPEIGTISNQGKMLIEFSKSFFSNSISTDIKPQQKKFMRRGRFFYYKLKFLLKTHKSCQSNFLKTIKELFVFLWSFYSYTKNPNSDIKFGSDLYVISGKKIYEDAIKNGYPSESLFLCGNIRYDSLFKNLKKFKEKSISKKLQILMITAPFYEHGWWSKKQRDNIITSIIKKINECSDYALTIKIHPSSENLSEYKKITNNVDPVVPIFQKGDISKFLENHDLVISFLTSDAVFSSLFSEKPVVFFNAGQYKNDLLVQRELVSECNSIETLPSIIDNAYSNQINQIKKINSFVEDYFFKSDGQASERLTKKLFELLKKQNIK